MEEWRDYFWRYANEIVLKYPEDQLRKLPILSPLRRILEIFKNYQVSSTFFVSGGIARSSPEVVEEIHNLGHEVASHGYCHEDLTQLDKNDFEKMEKMNKGLLTKITGDKPKGFRAPAFNINTEIINSLERIGYVYDSSVVPSIKIPGWFGSYGVPLHPYHPSKHSVIEVCEGRNFYEVPLAAFPFLRLPAAGGWFLRNAGVDYIKAAINLLLRRKYPVVLYVHLQDLSLGVPRIDGVPFHVFRNCGRYALKAIENILRNVEARKITISEIVSTVSQR